MSGVDEQVTVQEVECPECGCRDFYKVDYGAITDRFFGGTNVVRHYREGTFQRNDSEDWQCYGCYERANPEIKEHILQTIEQEENR